jgi:hypothetical protein
MILPFHVSCNQPAVRLFELDDGRFQLIQQGRIAPFMDGYRYLLVEESLARFLQALDVAGIRIEPAIIYNRESGEEIRSHSRIHVSHYFAPLDIRDLRLSGMKMQAMLDEHYFVSPELMAALRDSPFKFLVFTEGLADFAGNAA